MKNDVHKFTKLKPTEVEKYFETSCIKGLTADSVTKRREKYGDNELVEAKKPNLLMQIIHHLDDITSLILLFAVALSAYLALTTDSDWTKAIVIGAIVILNVGIALFQEHSAEKALSALKSMTQQTVTVIRAGEKQVIPTNELVPGDLISLESGDIVPADSRIIKSTSLSADEAILTGESLPIEKTANAMDVAPESLGDSKNMLFSGTAITQGTATAIVTATGMQTELGKIATLLNTTQKQQTPLSKRLDSLTKRLSFVAVLGGTATILIATLFHQETFTESLMFGVSLAIAAVPETLPVIVTLSMAHGVQKMAKKKAIIRQVSAVETIGNVNVIASDKTGTLTQNKMTITKYWPENKNVRTVEKIKGSEKLAKEDKQFLTYLGLSTNAELTTNGKADIGDPTELAIVHLLARFKMTRAECEKSYPRIAEDPFDSDKKTMTTWHKRPDGKYVAIIKGAIDRIPFGKSVEKNKLYDIHDQFAAEALRVLAAGFQVFDSLPAERNDDALTDIQLLGLIGIIDPPRPEVIPAIKAAQKGGIATVMITGDHLETAKAIAQEIGILKAGKIAITGQQLNELDDEEFAAKIDSIRVYARTSPADKIRIVKAWQSHGAIVAMTGDGVNDAPALKAANVGIAMGITGTEVSKNAADMVLADDNFATIIEAVKQGRTVYENILKAVEFLVSVNFAQIFTMVGAIAMGWGAPMTPEQLLIVNVLADGIPGFFLSREIAEPGIMNFSPIKKDTSIWSRGLGKRVAVRSATYIILILAIYVLGRFGLNNNLPEIGTTMLFLVLAIGSMLDIYPIKTRQSITKHAYTNNPALNKSLIFTLLGIVIIALFQPLATLFSIAALNLTEWVIVIVAIFIPTIVIELYKRSQGKIAKS
ncbi:cation-translocating P-type ATPase [Liquorilactobacillus oeni]|uniref:P-type Ca(2+) transporter n=1 Tax=Liquorilactobacillus oeni DSM 19972 TaxID=1423777 RepID=A0A0R1MAK8_9LACO|nr:cation-translocating P-type ATPase [Liquorilactobacillus oeni]KRL05184.1 cation transport ATPase [Liquorilactobacillus oeni DSM 19972]